MCASLWSDLCSCLGVGEWYTLHLLGPLPQLTTGQRSSHMDSLSFQPAYRQSRAKPYGQSLVSTSLPPVNGQAIWTVSRFNQLTIDQRPSHINSLSFQPDYHRSTVKPYGQSLVSTSLPSISGQAILTVSCFNQLTTGQQSSHMDSLSFQPAYCRSKVKPYGQSLISTSLPPVSGQAIWTVSRFNQLTTGQRPSRMDSLSFQPAYHCGQLHRQAIWTVSRFSQLTIVVSYTVKPYGQSLVSTSLAPVNSQAIWTVSRFNQLFNGQAIWTVSRFNQLTPVNSRSSHMDSLSFQPVYHQSTVKPYGQSLVSTSLPSVYGQAIWTVSRFNQLTVGQRSSHMDSLLFQPAYHCGQLHGQAIWTVSRFNQFTIVVS